MSRLHVVMHLMGGVLPSTHDLASFALATVVVAVVVANVVVALRRRHAPAPATRTVTSIVWGGWIAAACSIGAAAIHLAVIEDHLQEYVPFGVAFALLAVFQLAWPLAYLPRPARGLALVAIAINLGAVLIWLWSRTVGLPVGPAPTEPFGAADLISSILEVALAIALLPIVVAGRQVVPGASARRAGLAPGMAATIVGAAAGLVVVLTVAGLVSLGGSA